MGMHRIHAMLRTGPLKSLYIDSDPAYILSINI